MGGLLIALLVAAQADHQAEGLKALEARQWSAAVEAFQKAVAADPKDFAAYFHLGLAHSLAGQKPEAIAAYRKSLELKPGVYETEVNLGQVLIEAGEPREAVGFLQAATAAKPGLLRPAYLLAEAHLRAGDLEAAEKQAEVCREIEPKAEEIRSLQLRLAAEWEARKQWERATRLYLQYPDEPGARERAGVLLLEQGKPEEAAGHLEAAEKVSPTTANRFALATAYLRSRQPEKAAPVMERALQSDPKNAELRLAYGALLRDQKNYEGAAQQYYAGAQLKPDSREAWAGLATMLLSLERYPQAISAFDRLEALGDTNPGIYYLRALAYDRSKQYKPALADYQKFLARSQNRSPDEEFKARQRVRVIEKELNRR